MQENGNNGWIWAYNNLNSTKQYFDQIPGHFTPVKGTEILFSVAFVLSSSFDSQALSSWFWAL